MKRAFVFLTLVVLLSLVGGTVASAQSGPSGTGWWSGEMVQNVSSASATTVVEAYDKNSTNVYSAAAQVVPAGGSVNYNPSSFATMPPSFQGSAVVSSDYAIKAVVNVTNMQNGAWGVSGGKAAAQYQGTETPKSTLYFPLVKNNRYGKTTAFYVQNAGGSAATATATFRMDDGRTYTKNTASIGPNKMVIIMPADAGVPNTDANRANIGSLKVTSTQALAGVVLEFTVSEPIATVLGSTRAFTSDDFGTKAYAPIVKHNRYGRFTGIQVQNVSTGPINVTIKYVGSAKNNAACLNKTSTDSFNGIPAGASHTFNQADNQTNFPTNCTGAATIQATGNFVAIVSETNLSGFPTAAIMSAALPDRTATTRIVLPQFKDQRYGFTTGLQIMNVGAATATNVVAKFVCKGRNSDNTPFTAISRPQTIPVGGAKLFMKPSTSPTDFLAANPFAMAGAVCGVTVTGDQKVVAIANESPDIVGTLDDNNYEGFNVTP